MIRSCGNTAPFLVVYLVVHVFIHDLVEPEGKCRQVYGLRAEITYGNTGWYSYYTEELVYFSYDVMRRMNFIRIYWYNRKICVKCEV